MPLDTSAIPNEVWFNITLYLDLEDALSLEAEGVLTMLTGRRNGESIYSLFFSVSDVQVPPRGCLRQILLAETPPRAGPRPRTRFTRHVPVSELTWSELRSLVVRAHLKHSNCAGLRTTPLRHTREATVPIGDGSRNGALFRVDDIG
ncbi:hypothetical protein DFH11DRAFT_1544888 [Phellopilus nigrolimitatus]|nr:hypothetical protein DFH11DRAFT_1544888 [Phellopilus nigrolimitatus]